MATDIERKQNAGKKMKGEARNDGKERENSKESIIELVRIMRTRGYLRILHTVCSKENR